MWQKTAEKNYYPSTRASLLARVVQKGLDLLQHILLLVAFLMFFSFVQVATASESHSQFKDTKESTLYLLRSDAASDESTDEDMERIENKRASVAILSSTDLGLRVTNTTSRATVTQTFDNTTGENTEGLYFFPLPKDAVLEVAQFIIGDRHTERLILPNRHARAEQFPDMFVTSIGTIGPGEQVQVKIIFQQPVAYSKGQFQLRMQMAIRKQPVSLHLELDAGHPLSDIESLTHDIHKSSHGAGRYSIRFRDDVVLGSKDFVLVWTPETGLLPQGNVESTAQAPLQAFAPNPVMASTQLMASTSTLIQPGNNPGNNSAQSNNIIPLSAQTGTDSQLKLLVGLVCVLLALSVRIILLRFYSSLPRINQRVERGYLR